MDTRVPAGSPASALIRSSGSLLGLAFAIATVIVIRFTAPWATTYSGQSPASFIPDLLAGLGIIAVGMLLKREQQRDVGLLAMLAGVSWLAADWIGWQDGPPLARSVASIVAPLFPPIVFHLVVTFRTDRTLLSRLPKLLAASYGIVAAMSIGHAFIHDPRDDLYCWSNCTDNSFLIVSNADGANALGTVSIGIALAIAILVVFGSLYRLIRSTPAARRAVWVVLVPGLLVGASNAVHAAALLREPLEGPQSEGYAALFQARAWSLAALALGLAWTILLTRRTRAAVARLASDLGDAPSPGSLRDSLRRATNDPTLEIAYRLPGNEGFADATGAAVEVPAPREGLSVTPIVREGLPAAVVLHDPSAVAPEGLEREMGPTARLAVDNERLQAAILMQLVALQDSRTRIVQAEDDERRRLERNLHDGAQQQLLALLYDVKVAGATEGASNDPQLKATLDSALEELHSAIADLREVAHGIYPAILFEVGLGQALVSLAEASPIAVEPIVATDERFPAPVERAAYVAVAEVLQKAAELGTKHVGIVLMKKDDRLAVRIEGAAPISFGQFTDRLGALGGNVTSHGDSVWIEIPCA